MLTVMYWSRQYLSIDSKKFAFFLAHIVFALTPPKITVLTF